MDNLESQTYEAFEKDPVKYRQYERAIVKALELEKEKEGVDTTVLMVSRSRCQGMRHRWLVAHHGAARGSSCRLVAFDFMFCKGGLEVVCLVSYVHIIIGVFAHIGVLAHPVR